MANRDRVSEILEVKRRGQRGERARHGLRGLQTLWGASRKEPPISDFFPIRATTLLEVFTRDWITILVDAGDPYIERAITFAKNIKLDYDLLRGIQGRTITLGDIIAHSVPLNSAGQLIGAFETLLNEKVLHRLATTIDRCDVELWQRPAEPIIPNIQNMASALDRLFRARHILVHEYPKTSTYEIDDVPVMLKAAADFAAATQEILVEILYGKVPLTMLDMKDAANQEYKKISDEIELKLAQLLDKQRDDEGKQLLRNAQAHWTSYCKAQSEFIADTMRGGSMAGLLWVQEARALAEQRLKQMSAHLEREDNAAN